jgi:geranylgeranyl transferase type-2 subunit alpha
LEGKNVEGLNEEGKRNVSEWLSELKKLDPLRKGRWEDMGRELR